MRAAPGRRTGRNRRDGAGGWARSVLRWGAAMGLFAMLTLAGRSHRAHLVVAIPAAIHGTVALVVGGSIVVPVRGSGDSAAGQEGGGQSDGGDNPEEPLHLVTALVSVSCHSSSPKGAPNGSATTATIPP